MNNRRSVCRHHENPGSLLPTRKFQEKLPINRLKIPVSCLYPVHDVVVMWQNSPDDINDAGM
jgi:hypothetical protein